MRIAFFLPLYPPYRGGASTDGAVLGPELGARVDLTIVTERADGYPASQILTAPGGQQYRVLRILPRYASLEANGVRKVLLLLANRLATILAVIRVRIVMGADICHLHGQYARFGLAYVLSTVGHVMGMRMVLDIRDKGVTGTGLNLFDKVLAASRSVAANVQNDLSPGKLMLTPIPHTMPDLLPAEGLPERFFLFVGTVRRLKGVDVLIAAYRRYRDEGGTVPLVLIGPIIDESLVASPDLLVLGPRPPGFVASAMKRCTLFLLPSRSEGLPHVCLEAIDLRTPFVVGPGIPELEQYCPDNVLPGVTADDIFRVLKDPEAVPPPLSFDLRPHAPATVATLLTDLYRTLLA